MGSQHDILPNRNLRSASPSCFGLRDFSHSVLPVIKGPAALFKALLFVIKWAGKDKNFPIRSEAGGAEIYPTIRGDNLPKNRSKLHPPPFLLLEVINYGCGFVPIT